MNPTQDSTANPSLDLLHSISQLAQPKNENASYGVEPGESAGKSVEPCGDSRQSSAAVKNSVSTKHRPLSERVKEMSLKKLNQRISHGVGRAIADFNMIEDGDKILVAISGGKDSWVLLHILEEMRKKAPIQFSMVAVNIDQGFSNFRQDIVESHVDELEIDHSMEEFDIADILREKISKEDVPCSLCAKLRRGSLYGLAEKMGCNKIALGHHLDDFIETLLLNSFFVGRLASMAAVLTSNDQKNTVIRPLVYVTEAEIREYALRKEMPIVSCACPMACGNTDKFDSKRKMIKNMINILETSIPGVRYSLLKSLANVRPSHLLDRELIEKSRSDQ